MQIRPLWPFFPVERLGLGKRDFFQKIDPRQLILGLIFNFLIDISQFHLKLKNEKVEFPFFPLLSLCFWRERLNRCSYYPTYCQQTTEFLVLPPSVFSPTKNPTFHPHHKNSSLTNYQWFPRWILLKNQANHRRDDAIFVDPTMAQQPDLHHHQMSIASP